MSVNVPASEWRLSTAGGIPYKLISRDGNFDAENAEAQEIYLIRAGDLLAFIAESFPLPVVFLDSLAYTPRRYFPGMPSMPSQRVTWKTHTEGLPIDPWNVDSGAPDGTYLGIVEVTIDYATTSLEDPDNDDPRTFLEISSNAAGNFLAVPVRGNAYWLDIVGDVVDVEVKESDVPQTVIENNVEWTVHWPQIPFDFFDGELIPRLRSKMGKVNDTPMELLHNAPAETMMFLSYTTSQEYTWRSGFAGRTPIALDMKFLEKNFLDADDNQVTHNHVYRPGVGWRRMGINVTAELDFDPLYSLTNLDDIFAA